MTDPQPAREVIERTWNAPIEAVWAMWTTKAGIESWYGPRGFRSTIEALEVKVGGPFHCTMHADSPQMVEMMKARGRPTSWPNLATWTEVVRHKRLCFEMAVPMGPERPAAKMVHTVTFEETDAGVHMVFVLEATEVPIQGAAGGWRSSFDRMGEGLDV